MAALVSDVAALVSRVDAAAAEFDAASADALAADALAAAAVEPASISAMVCVDTVMFPLASKVAALFDRVETSGSSRSADGSNRFRAIERC